MGRESLGDKLKQEIDTESASELKKRNKRCVKVRMNKNG